VKYVVDNVDAVSTGSEYGVAADRTPSDD